MRRARCSDFPAGEIANRVIDALYDVSRPLFYKLVETKRIDCRNSSVDSLHSTLTYKNLLWNYLDGYALISGHSVHYFLFGTEQPDRSYFSDYDQEVIALIDSLPAETLRSVTQAIRIAYSNPKFAIGTDIYPSKKLILLNAMGNPLPAPVPEEEMFKYKTSINTELTAFRKFQFKDRFVFHIDYIPDLCTYYRVSPHWVFSLKGTLLCKTPEGDALFDTFCLLSPTQQIDVISTLLVLQPFAMIKIPGEALSRLRAAISQDRGVV